MKLLDLSPEVFERIIGYYVTDMGVREAWKRRMVCSKLFPPLMPSDAHILTILDTFATYIKTEVISNQPASALRKTNDRTLISHLLPEILERRVIKLNGIPNTLPDLIIKIIGRLTTAKGNTTEAGHTALVKRLCAVFGQHSNTILRLAFMPTKEQIASCAKSSIEEEALALAVGMGNQDLIRLLITSGVSAWSKTCLFGHIIEFATCKDLITFRFLLSLIQPSTNIRVKSGQKNSFGHRIVSILGDEKEDCAIEMLEYYLVHFHPASKSTVKNWHVAAMQLGSLKFLKRLLGDKSLAVGRVVTRSCLFGQEAYPENIAAVIRELLQSGIFDRGNINAPEPMKYEEHRGPHSATQSVLDIAVAQQDEVLVKELLEFGADADGVDVFELWDGVFSMKRKIIGRSFPLRTAIHLKHIEIVKLLIRFGADPCCGLQKKKALDEAPSVVNRDEREVWKMVKEAIRRKK
jgi:hypothetical protein